MIFQNSTGCTISLVLLESF